MTANLISFTSSHTLVQRYQHIKESLPAGVQLLCVTKTRPASDIAALVALGQHDFGENYVQECLAKQTALAQLPIVWHYIGHIQRNKTRDIAQHFSWVHTLERALIADRLNAQRVGNPLNVLIQVNIDNEASKSGCSVYELPALVVHCLALSHLRVRGLMIIPQAVACDDHAFIAARQLFDEIKDRYNPPAWDTLSMGMSADMASAIACGSTMVRIGSAIFGERG